MRIVEALFERLDKRYEKIFAGYVKEMIEREDEKALEELRDMLNLGPARDTLRIQHCTI